MHASALGFVLGEPSRSREEVTARLGLDLGTRRALDRLDHVIDLQLAGEGVDRRALALVERREDQELRDPEPRGLEG